MTGELLTSSGRLATLPGDRSGEFRMDAAQAALYVVLSVLVNLGYTIGIKKSVLYPSTTVEYLGFVVDLERQSFLIPRLKIETFAALRELILESKGQILVKTLQRFQGKCISLTLAVPAAKLFIREISRAIAAGEGSSHVTLNKAQREEVFHFY